MRLTTARYYTPSGRSIQALGIMPDIVVEQPLVDPNATPADGAAAIAAAVITLALIDASFSIINVQLSIIIVY